MDGLPLELLHQVIGSLGYSKESFLKLRTVNRAFCGIASRLAFRRLEVRFDAVGATSLEQLARCSGVMEFVEDIHVLFVGDLVCGTEFCQPSGFDAHPHAKAFSQLAQTFISLKGISLMFAGNVPRTLLSLQRYAASQLHIWGGIVRNAHLTALTSLTVTDLIQLPEHFFECDMFAESLSALKSLSVSFVYDADFEEAFSHGGDVVFPDDAYPPMANSTQWDLASLTLNCMQEVDYISRVDLSHLHFQHLSSLFLENITFHPLGFGPSRGPDAHTEVSNDAGAVEEFIIRHKASLHALTLNRCLSSYSTYRSPEGRRDWSTIWERFSRELFHLVNFSCEMTDPNPFTLEDSDSLTLGYGDIDDDTGMYFCQNLDDSEMAKRDDNALEKLVQIVEERKGIVV